MAIVTGILTFLQTLMDFVKSYFPPKATESKVEDGETEVADEIKKEEGTGRPS